MDTHDFIWAMNHVLKGKAVGRDSRNWAGKKVFRQNKQTITIEKHKHNPLKPHCEGQVIVAPMDMVYHEGVVRPYIPSNEDCNAEDWCIV